MDLFLVLGYLGSGKTTFLKKFLTFYSDRRVGVVVNDFGAQDVDGRVLSAYSDLLQSVTGGSIFCSCRSDGFVKALAEIARREPEMVVVESSGLANPFAMLDVLGLAEREAGRTVRLRGVVALADASAFERAAAAAHMVKMQVACADWVLVNKCDTVSAQDAERVEGLCREINPGAEIFRTVEAEADFARLGKTEHQPRKLPINLNDLGAQRVLLKPCGQTDLALLARFCARLMQIAHRVKGYVDTPEGAALYEYVNGGVRLSPAERPPEGAYLVALGVTNKSLARETDQLLSEFPDLKWRRAEP